MPEKILITGPESTGKSTLTRALAEYFNAPFVIEYARIYLDMLDRKYNQDDLLEIAKGQIRLEEEAIALEQGFVIVDTALNVIDIWSREKFGSTHPWILEEMQKRAYDLYLIPDVDLEWSFDPQRENPHDRDRLMRLYQQSFEQRNIPYHMVRGQGEVRTQNAIDIIKRKLLV